MKLEHPLALILSLPLFFFATAFWFYPNAILHGETKYIISIIELSTAILLVGFSFGGK